MPEFNIRTDSVDVEQIMRQIRARITEKRGVDYTEQQIQELANVKLERFLDPKGVRSDLVEHFRRTRDPRLDPFQPQQYGFDAAMLYDSHRGLVRLVRRILNPILKLFFNPNPLIQVLHQQTQINALYEKQFYVLREKSQQRDELDALYYELIHNLVLELTRLGIEARNLKMRLESLSSRMDFDERRARALEGVVQYKPDTGPAREAQPAQPTTTRTPEPSRYQPRPSLSSQSQPPQRPRSEPAAAKSFAEAGTAPAAAQPTNDGISVPGAAEQPADAAADAATGTARRRRRRRRGRRGGRGRGLGEGGAPVAGTPPHGDPLAEAALGPEGAPHAEGTARHQPQSDYYDSEANSSETGLDADADEGPEPSEQ
jgi:hypothetical protein